MSATKIARHSWEKIRIHHYVCRQCGVVKLNIEERYTFTRWGFRTEFVRAGLTWSGTQTPPCDETWPAGWTMEQAADEAPSTPSPKPHHEVSYATKS